MSYDDDDGRRDAQGRYRQSSGLERAIGRIEGKLSGISEEMRGMRDEIRVNRVVASSEFTKVADRMGTV
jgi:hypothetical protein